MRRITFEGLRKANGNRSIDWCGHKVSQSDAEFCTIELAGEAGEVADAIKKRLRFERGMVGGEESLQPIVEELADLIICADRLAACYNIDLASAVEAKFNKTSHKHGFKSFHQYLEAEYNVE